MKPPVQREPSISLSRDTWVGVYGGLDLAVMGTTNSACYPGISDGYRCYDADGVPVSAGPDPDRQGKVSSGYALASPVLLASLDRSLGDGFQLGLRLGLRTSAPRSTGMLLRGEARLARVFGSAGSVLRPNAFIGLGVARVSAGTQTEITDDSGQITHVTAYHDYGPFYVTVGAGLSCYVAPNLALDASFAALGLGPDFGAAFEPRLGASAGF